jgi:hypothetical protein
MVSALIGVSLLAVVAVLFCIRLFTALGDQQLEHGNLLHAIAAARHFDHTDEYLNDEDDCNTEKLRRDRHMHRTGYYKGIEDAFIAIEHEQFKIKEIITKR